MARPGYAGNPSLLDRTRRVPTRSHRSHEPPKLSGARPCFRPRDPASVTRAVVHASSLIRSRRARVLRHLAGSARLSMCGPLASRRPRRISTARSNELDWEQIPAEERILTG